MFCLNSEEYHPTVKGFNSVDTIHKLFYNSRKEEDLNVMIKQTGHLFMTDLLTFAPIEFKMTSGYNPTNDVKDMYELGNKVVSSLTSDHVVAQRFRVS